MKRNDQVIKDFINGRESANVNLRSTGDKLINYNTCLAQKRGNTMYVNDTRYSVSTSKIQGMLRQQVEWECNVVEYMSGVPINTWNLLPLEPLPRRVQETF